MATTPREIIEAAYAKSLKNQPGAIASDAELLGQVIRVTRKYYAGAARINPWFFGESASVAWDGTTWPRPDTAEAVFRLEQSGVEVVVVPSDDRAAEATSPSVSRLGQAYYPAGNATDPAASPVDFFYSRRPTDPASLDATIDSSWPEQFNELLILDIAVYLAVKDGQQEDLMNYGPQLQEWQMLYRMFLEHETSNERRRTGQRQRFNTAELFPIPASIGG